MVGIYIVVLWNVVRLGMMNFFLTARVKHYMVGGVEGLDQIIPSFGFFQFSTDNAEDVLSSFIALSSWRCGVDGTKHVNLVFLDNTPVCSSSSFDGKQRVQQPAS